MNITVTTSREADKYLARLSTQDKEGNYDPREGPSYTLRAIALEDTERAAVLSVLVKYVDELREGKG